MLAEREVVLYCDFHGHSRKNNVFMYGCDGSGAGTGQRLRQRVFPLMLSKNVPDKVGHSIAGEFVSLMTFTVMPAGDAGNMATVPLPKAPPLCPCGAG